MPVGLLVASVIYGAALGLGTAFPIGAVLGFMDIRTNALCGLAVGAIVGLALAVRVLREPV